MKMLFVEPSSLYVRTRIFEGCWTGETSDSSCSNEGSSERQRTLSVDPLSLNAESASSPALTGSCWTGTSDNVHRLNASLPISSPTPLEEALEADERCSACSIVALVSLMVNVRLASAASSWSSSVRRSRTQPVDEPCRREKQSDIRMSSSRLEQTHREREEICSHIERGGGNSSTLSLSTGREKKMYDVE